MAGAQFGWSVALDGDTAIVGARLDDDTAGSDQGSVYVFTRSGSTWTEQAKLIASDAAADDQFGYSVAIDGDTAIVGANRDEDAGNSSGSVYVFTRSGSTWTEQAKLTASDAAAGDQFGFSVAISGDSAIAGARLNDDGAGSDQGSAYIFKRRGASWIEHAKFASPDALAGDQFGYSVAIDGDRAIVGARDDEDAAGTIQGSAWIFDVRPDVPFDCLPSVFNTTAGTAHQTFTDAFGAATAFDSLIATPVTFRLESPIDPMSTPVVVESSGDIRLPVGATLTVGDGSLFAAAMGARVSLYGGVTVGPEASLLSGAGMRISGVLSLQGGTLMASDARITGSLLGAGEITAETRNDGDVTVQADLLHDGDYTNNGATTIESGTLTLLGELTNNGAIVGDLQSPPRSIQTQPGDGFNVSGSFSASTTASLIMSSDFWRVTVSGDFDVAIDDNARYDMAQAELRIGGALPIVLECMSLDIGADESGFDRTQTGHFPIGTLRLTGNVTSLVDTHDNDGLGQSTKEAHYTRHVIIEPGATLNTNGGVIYYETLTNNGNVDDLNNLVKIGCPADINNDGTVSGPDLAGLLALWGTDDAAADLTGDGVVGGADLAGLLAAWGPCP